MVTGLAECLELVMHEDVEQVSKVIHTRLGFRQISLVMCSKDPPFISQLCHKGSHGNMLCSSHGIVSSWTSACSFGRFVSQRVSLCHAPLAGNGYDDQ